ncbi:hypothetical protein WG922_08985 [Ramlibacter sp. AN1015]|uniref:lipase family protein n=1 Tax=Ramlibacter sp. AN1015 TaxID=3133428 RepID=UPI0030BF4997
MTPILPSGLQSNLYGAIRPTPGRATYYLLRYAGEVLREKFGALWRANPRQADGPSMQRPPGNARPMAAAPMGATPPRRTLRPVADEPAATRLPHARIADFKSYFDAAMVAYTPALSVRQARTANLADAFQKQGLLPQTLLTSPLLNRGAWGNHPGEPVRAPGKVKEGPVPNALYDPLTGFAAAISVRAQREVVIGFGPLGSQAGVLGAFSQACRSFLGWLGFSSTRNMQQAAELTAQVKAHLATLNKSLPPGERYTLTLAGHSMGGCLATFAALKNGVPAVVTEPLRLSLAAQGEIGRERMKQAPDLVEELMVDGDWIASVNAISLQRGPIGTRYTVPRPSEDQIEHINCLLRGVETYSPHMHVDHALNALAQTYSNQDSQAEDPQEDEDEEASVVRHDAATMPELESEDDDEPSVIRFHPLKRDGEDPVRPQNRA